MKLKQNLYLVFGGKLKKIGDNYFSNPDKLDLVGIYNSLAKAKEIWKTQSIKYIDDATKKFKVVPLFNIVDPSEKILDYLLKIKHLKMSNDYIIGNKKDSLQNTIIKLQNSKASAAIIIEENRIIGIFTEKDIVKNFSKNLSKIINMPILNFATKNVKTVDPEKSILHALEILKKNGFRHLPVYDKKNKKFYGIISYKNFTIQFLER